MDITGLLDNKRAMRTFFYSSIFSAAFIGAMASLPNGFVWDDMHIVTNPVLIDKKGTFYGYFFDKGLYYRPFIKLSFALDWSMWRMSPLGYHLHNILIHVANSVLVFVVAGRLMEDGDMPAFLAALVFALHPAHTEPIAWISGRTDLLVTFFFLLSFLGFLVYRWEDDIKGIVVCAMFYLFAMFSKENGAAMIAVALAYGLLTRMPLRRLLISSVILSAVVILYFILRQWSGLTDVIMRPGTQGAYLSSAFSLKTFLYTLVYGSGYYIEKLFLPLNLNLLPAIPEGIGYALIFCAALGGTIYCFIRCAPSQTFLILWIFLTMLPSLSIMFSQVAAPLGERYLYLPSVGFSILIVGLLAKALNRRFLIGFVILISIGFFVLSNERFSVWYSDLTLWGNTARKSPSSAVAHTNYGIAMMQEKDITGAEKELFTALRIPDNSKEQTALILNSLSNVEIFRKNYKKASKYLIEAIDKDPNCTAAYNNLGYVYMQMSAAPGVDEKGRVESLKTAISYFDKAAVLAPWLSQTKFNLGICYFSLDDYDKAEKYFYDTVDADPLSELGKKAAMLLTSAKMRKTAGSYLRR
ncbi:MAG: hypothetical protein HQL01_06735 [Nitrospirae bacterium]|nr:hypothetical protein [Nitrospirota bacterium]